MRPSSTRPCSAARDDWRLLQNWPKPFTDETTIGFVLPPGGCDAQLRLYDAAGRELWRTEKAYPGGYHTERIQLKGQIASGVLYCELTTPFGTQTRKLVRMEK